MHEEEVERVASPERSQAAVLAVSAFEGAAGCDRRRSDTWLAGCGQELSAVSDRGRGPLCDLKVPGAAMSEEGLESRAKEPQGRSASARRDASASGSSSSARIALQALDFTQ